MVFVTLQCLQITKVEMNEINTVGHIFKEC